MGYFADLLSDKGFTEVPQDNGIRRFARVQNKTQFPHNYQPIVDVVLLRKVKQNTRIDLFTYGTDFHERPSLNYSVGLFDEAGNPADLDNHEYAGSIGIKSYLESI